MDEQQQLSGKAKQHAEQFGRVVGYSTAMAQRLRPMPNSSQNRPIRDSSLYNQRILPGRDAEQPFKFEHLGNDHIPLKDKPLAIRDILCFTVPCDLLEPNAATFASYNIANIVACLHSHALAFFFYALYCAAQLDKCDLHVYIEAVVRDPLALPVVYSDYVPDQPPQPSSPPLLLEPMDATTNNFVSPPPPQYESVVANIPDTTAATTATSTTTTINSAMFSPEPPQRFASSGEVSFSSNGDGQDNSRCCSPVAPPYSPILDNNDDEESRQQQSTQAMVVGCYGNNSDDNPPSPPHQATINAGRCTMREYRAMDEHQIATWRISATARNNLVGYRVWALLMANCYGVEVMLRRALFRCQALVYPCALSTAEAKLRYCTLPSDEREQAMRVDAEAAVLAEESKQAAGRKQSRGGRGRGGADANPRMAAALAVLGDDAAAVAAADDDGGEAGYLANAGIAVAPDVAEARERSIRLQISKLEQQVCDPVPLAFREFASIYSSGDVGSQFVSINTMETYLDMFLTPLIAMSNIGELPRKYHEYAELLKVVARKWGETTRLDQVDGPLGAALSARAVLSFERSIATFKHGVERDLLPCDVQLNDRLYGLLTGDFHFPIPALVWAISSTQRLAPDSLMRHALPWHVERFDEQLRKLRAEVTAQSRARTEQARAVRSTAPPSVSQLLTETALARRKRPSTGESVNVDYVCHIERRKLGMLQPLLPEFAEDDDDATHSALNDADRNSLVEELSKLLLGDTDPLQLAMMERDTRTTTEVIIGDVAQLCDEFYSSWAETLRLVEQLQRPHWVQPCEERGWREEKLRALNAVRIDDQMAKLLQVLNSGPLVSEHHRSVYRNLTRGASLEYLVRSQPSIAPNMTVVANVIIEVMTYISFFKLQHGEIELLETLFVLIPQSAIPHLENADHRVLIGAPATAKSLGHDRARQMALPGAIVQRDHVSSKAEYTAGYNSNTVLQYDEAGSTYTDHRHEAISRNAEYSREKQKMSTNERVFERYTRDEVTGQVFNHRVRTERVALNDMLTNNVHFGGWSSMRSDSALVSRMNFLFFAPWQPVHGSSAGRAVDVLTDMHSDKLKRVLSSVSERHKEEQALTNILLLMSVTSVCTSLNTDCIDIVQRCAFDELEHWMPRMVRGMRQVARANQYAETIVYSTVSHALTNSEASELVLDWVPDPDPEDDDHRGRVVPVPMKFTINDLPALFAPYMYARVEHGLWAAFRLINIQYQFLTYLVLREIASLFNFRRMWMEHAYRRVNAELISTAVERRWAERGCSTAAYPEFLQYLLDAEQLMDNDVVARTGNMEVAPRFAAVSELRTTITHTVLAAAAEDDDGGGGTYHRGRGGGRLRTDRAAVAAQRFEQAIELDPNWIDTGMEHFRLAAEATPYIQRRFRIEQTQVDNILDNMAAYVTVQVPVMANIKPGVLARGLTPNDIQFLEDNSVTGGARLRYEERRLVEQYKNPLTGQTTVRISTGGLMVPPQMLACLALTAFENKHTRPRDTVLLSEVPGHSAWCVPWQVRPRPDRTLTMSAVREPGVFTQRMLFRTARTRDPLSVDVATHVSSSSGAVRIDKDIEDVAFERHMRDLRQMPPLHKVMEALKMEEPDAVERVCDSYSARHRDWTRGSEMAQPTFDELECIFKLWLRHHAARPDAMEQRRAALQRSHSMFAPISTPTMPHSCYPRSHLISDEITHAFNRLAHSAEPLPSNRTRMEAMKKASAQRVTLFQKQLSERKTQLAAATPEDAELLTPYVDRAHEQLYDASVECEYLHRVETLVPTIVDHPANPEFEANERDRKAYQDVYDIEIILQCYLCSMPWFSEYTVKLYDTPTWKPVLSAAIAALSRRKPRWLKCAPDDIITTCPTEPYTLDDEDNAVIKRSIKMVPGLMKDEADVLQFSLNMLHWLERSMMFNELITDITLIYATHESRPEHLSMCTSLLANDKMPVQERMRQSNALIKEAKSKYITSGDAASAELLRRYEDARMRCKRLRVLYNNEEHPYWSQLGKVDVNWHTAKAKLAPVLSEPSSRDETNRRRLAESENAYNAAKDNYHAQTLRNVQNSLRYLRQ